MVHLRDIVDEGWDMVQESKLWYDYIVMVRSGNAGRVILAVDATISLTWRSAQKQPRRPSLRIFVAPTGKENRY